MDKNAIKKYAVWARRELISRVSQRAALYEITDKGYGDASADSVLGRVMSAEEKRQRQALIAQIREKGFEQVMEEIAYTWFNRFIALRFMEVNGYLPSHVRVFTDDDNNFRPQILSEAINMELDGLNMEKVYALKNANDDDALFKYMIIVQCNALSSILPGMFQHISDFTELLFPDNLLREGSVIEQMVSMIPEEDWTDQVQIIGWLYQYYNTEPKDTVFADLKKNIKISKENIPAATQQFTPDWIVRYLVENSLGRLWLEGHPNDELKATWKYYLDEAEQEPEVQSQLIEIRKKRSALTPEDIRVIDPCQGSGHILAYMFDVLVQIYEAYGHTSREAAASIVEKNIWGLDIDDRASQLAYFSVMMKARQYDRRFFSRGIQPHVFSIQESNNLDTHCIEYFVGDDKELNAELTSLIEDLHDAKEYGSILKVRKVDFPSIYAHIEEISNLDSPSLYGFQVVEELLPLVRVAEALAQQYDVVVTNPPYRGISDVGDKLQVFAKTYYPDSKTDLSTICMERAFAFSKVNGFVAMINIPVWMFIASYEKLRAKIMKDRTYINMLHCGRGIFGSDFGTTAFIIGNSYIHEYRARFYKLFKKQGGVDTLEQKEKWFFERKGEYFVKQDDFSNIAGAPLAYWINQDLYWLFKESTLGKFYSSGGRFKTCNDEKYLKYWWDVPYGSERWHPYCKGGDGRKYSGNMIRVVDWCNDAQIFYSQNGGVGNRIYWGHKGITWSTISTSVISFREKESDYFNSSSAPTVFAADESLDIAVLAYLNAKPAAYLLNMFNPTASLTVADVLKLPFSTSWNTAEIRDYSSANILDCKADWNAFEISREFKTHPLIGLFVTIKDAFNEWSRIAETRYSAVQERERLINQFFIEEFGLDDELSPDPEEVDVTVRKADLNRDIRSFLSYAVGCMFGRYSLDFPGLAYAGGEWDASKYMSFQPDKDNIIPICDDEYFEDDIVGRFMKFIETVYGKETLEENLRFIADALGGQGSPREVIRNYFINDFYSDHLKVYQKCPIYWLFDSGKKNGFKCLIYMHRYQPDTIARIRTDYVHEQQSRYRTAIADLESRISNAGTSERVKLSKQLTKLQEQAEELRVYEEKIHHLADQMIRIDLDDGVKHNYAIFQDVLAKIK